MSTIGTDYSSLFSGFNTSSSSSSVSSSDFLSDWASLKNGSYAKLSKAYYKKTDSAASVSKAEANKETVKQNNKVKAAAQDLKDSLDEVNDSESLKKFVDNYNAMIKAGADSDNNSILRNTLSMTKLTQANENTLSKLGITIGEDNKLILDEEQAKKADKSAFTSLFSGVSSYGDMISSRASEIVNKVNYENNKLSNYDQSGSYAGTGSVGNIYDGSY